MVLELARSLPKPLPGPSIAIALFDAEEARGDRDFAEDGKRGSRQYVALAESAAARGLPPLDEIRAMVLFDMVGDCDLEVPYEAELRPGALRPLREADPETFAGETPPIDDDHVPFLERGVPAVDLIDFDYGPGRIAGRLLAHRRGHARQGLPGEPRRDRRGRARGAADDSVPPLAR